MPKWAWNLIQIVWSSTSGPMREAIVKSVKEWEVKAKQTPGEFDDVVVEVIKWLLVIK